MRIEYRPEIDGLRALAVLSVVFFHAGSRLFCGGYVGVDMFFVISGYLITGIMYRDMSNSTFSLAHFYERRIRRILPALFAMCALTYPFFAGQMLPMELKEFGQSLVSLSLFASNLFFWRKAVYFGGSAELKPLLHTWSLSVEEQFYLIFPLFMLALYRQGTKIVLWTICLFACASLAYAEWGSSAQSSANFYFLPSRIWEFFVGAAALIGSRNMKNRRSILIQLLALFGIILILYGVFFFDKNTPFPSMWGLFPVLGTAIVLCCVDSNTFLGRALSSPPLVGIGLISYSLYLWHQPIFAFARISSLSALSYYDMIALITLSIVVALVSWRWIEQPFRFGNRSSRGVIFAGGFAVILGLACSGFALHFGAGFPNRFEKNVVQYEKWADDIDRQSQMCIGKTTSELSLTEDSCIYNAAYPRKIAIWGDSHAMALAGALSHELSTYNIGLLQYTYTGCLPALGLYTSNRHDSCPEFNQLVFEHLSREKDIDTIVIFGRWTIKFEGAAFDNTEGGIEQDSDSYAIPVGEHLGFINNPSRVDKVGDLVRETIEGLLHIGKHVILVYPTPEAGWDVPRHLAREAQRGIQRVSPLSTSFDVFKNRTHRTYTQLDKIKRNDNLLRIYPENLFCNTDVTERCVVQHDQKPLYFDDDHINSIGSEIIAKNIVETMRSHNLI